MPPVTATFESPARIAWSARPSERMPDAQTLLIGLRGDLFGDPALDLGLARGDLPLAGLQHLTEDDLLDLIGGNPGAVEGGLDDGAAEVGGVEGGESAAHLPEGGACGTEDH